MTNLKNNIDHYMQRKGIKMYSHLLIDVAHQLGIKGQDAYSFAEREKANFSKMLKGERPLKYEFIIPLEKIFGVSLAKMLDEDAYKLPVKKDEVPFIKGFRYYAYKDDPELYKEELKEILNVDGRSIFTNTDEFGKTFIDYIVEYNSVNGVRFLHDTYHIKLKWYHNQFDIEPKGTMWTRSDNAIEFARLVASIGDEELFNDIYDTYNMFASNGFYLPEIVYSQPDFIEIILDHDNIYKTIFKIKEYNFRLGAIGKRKTGKESVVFHSINPIINGCLNHALKHLDKYRSQAIEILEFGIRHNERIKNSLPEDRVRYGYFYANELGGIFNDKKEIVDVAIISDINDTTDKEINALINKLPKFR